MTACRPRPVINKSETVPCQSLLRSPEPMAISTSCVHRKQIACSVDTSLTWRADGPVRLTSLYICDDRPGRRSKRQDVPGDVLVPIAREATLPTVVRAFRERQRLLHRGYDTHCPRIPTDFSEQYPFPTRQDATATNRVSRITVTLIWPGYCKVSWICSAMSRPSSTQPLSSMSLGCTSTRSSRPACRA